MDYAKPLAETHEREFLRYRKITADGRDLPVDPRDLYDMLELDKRTDRVLPNGLCMLPPRQACNSGNACLTCDKFATDASYLPEHEAAAPNCDSIDERSQAFLRRPAGHERGQRVARTAPDRARALGRSSTLEQTAPPTQRRPGRSRRRHRAHAPPTKTASDERDAARNPDNLRAAAARKRAAAHSRADTALAKLVARREPVTFRGLLKPRASRRFPLPLPLRARVEAQRATGPTAAVCDGESPGAADSPVVRTLAAQLRDLKRRHREEITELEPRSRPLTARTCNCDVSSGASILSPPGRR